MHIRLAPLTSSVSVQTVCFSSVEGRHCAKWHILFASWVSYLLSFSFFLFTLTFHWHCNFSQYLLIFLKLFFFCSWWKNTNSAIDVAVSHSAISVMNTITTVRYLLLFFVFFPFFNLGHAEFYSAASSRCYNFRPKPFSLILSFFNSHRATSTAVIICCFVILPLIIHYVNFLAIK